MVPCVHLQLWRVHWVGALGLGPPPRPLYHRLWLELKKQLGDRNCMCMQQSC